MNNWKIVAVMLFLVAVTLSISLYQQYTATYNLGSVQIKKTTLDDFTEVVGDDFVLCNMDKDECVRVGRLE